MKKGTFKNILKVISITAAAVAVAAVILLLWWKGLFIPGSVKWANKEFVFEGFNVCLDKRELSIYSGGKTAFDKIWKSDWDVSVQDALQFDIDKDGSNELILLVWKRGSYGDHMPFWEEHNDTRLQQHIFIYTYDDKEHRIKPIWMSSDIAYVIEGIEEGPMDCLIVKKSTGESDAWIWDEWGLKYWCDLPTMNGYILSRQEREESGEVVLEDMGDSLDSQNKTDALEKEGIKEETEPKKVSFVAVGDNLIHPGICSVGNRNGFDFDYFYENVKDTIEGADLAAINQETIFVKNPSEVSNYPAFGTIVNLGDAIVNSGFDIVSIANNHTLDKGMYGIDTTAEFYESLPEGTITYTGIHPTWEENTENPECGIKVIEKNGIKIALLSLTYSTNGIPSPKDYPNCVERFDNEERTLEQLKLARQMGDVVIVFAHWGTEYSKTVDAYQKKWRDIMLENGVDVVIGSHPHVLQEYEMVSSEDGRNMLVYYSLGNFISGQFKEECLIGGIAEFEIIMDESGNVIIDDYTLQKVETKHSNGKYSVFYKED